MVDELTAAVWADDLSDITFAEGMTAMREHFRTSESRLMPAHIVKFARAKRSAEITSNAVPENCGNHRWTQDGTCSRCLARDPQMGDGWNAPAWGDGVPVDKPDNFDEMVEAARLATEAMITKGYGRGDNATKDAAWRAADASWRAGLASVSAEQ